MTTPHRPTWTVHWNAERTVGTIVRMKRWPHLPGPPVVEGKVYVKRDGADGGVCGGGVG